MTKRRRLRPGRDLGVAIALTALSLASLPYLDHASAGAEPGPMAVVLVMVAGGALVVRSRWPIGVLIVSGGATATYLALGYAYGFVMVCTAVAVYTLAARVGLRTAIGWSIATLAALFVHVLTNPAAIDGARGFGPAAAWVVVPLTLGAARRLVLDAQARERAAADRRLIDAERLRLSQEVHDVVGHGLAAIQMQAGIALHLTEQKPEQAHTALEAIGRTSADALAELRATLASISPTEQADRTPPAGMANLSALCERVEAAGVAVDLTVAGRPRPLPWGVDLAAYRVLQEALTNVVKHSADPQADVRVHYRGDALDLVVKNRAPDIAVPGLGRGISGMRRRVDQLGGTLTAGRSARTGGPSWFELRAALPAPAVEDA